MMNSDYDLTGGQQFSTKVQRMSDGRYKASAPGTSDVPAVFHATQHGAISKMSDLLAAYVARNYTK